ncbi:hypothetical protein [Lichenicola sp.]|uniref:hypothetical protein n=1 Tax=Lichenicola sp. TaxID=2804529 RepID=UPI003B00B4A1
MEPAPLLILNPVRSMAAGMQLIVPGRPPIPMLRGLEPIHRFNPGWHAESLFTLFDPVWLLLLQHEDGNTACWYVDSSGGITNMPQDYTGPEQKLFRGRLQSVALWMRMAAGARIRVPATPAVLLYAALPTLVQREIDPLLEPGQISLLHEAIGRHARNPGASLSADAPPLVFEQPRTDSGTFALHLGNPGRLVPVSSGGRPIILPPGWRVATVHAVFAPLLTIILHHVGGARTTWFTDLDGRLLGIGVGGLPPELQEHVAAAVAPVFEDLWTSLVLGEGPSTTPPDIRIGELGLAELAELAPAHLRRLGERPDTRIAMLDEPATLGREARIADGTGTRPIDPDRLAGSLSHPLTDELDRLLETGRMLWPSPVDGRMIESDGFALLLGPRNFAYRFRDTAAGLVFHVISCGDHPGASAIWFPTIDLLVAATRQRAAGCVAFAQARGAILHHLLRFGAALLDGARRRVDPTMQLAWATPAEDVAGHIRNDLAGTSSLLRAVAGHRRLPNLHLFGAGLTSPPLGPLERIFPMFTGRVTRHEQDFEAVTGMFYRRNQRVIRYLSATIPVELGHAVIHAAETTPGLEATRKAADAARAEGMPVVLLGLDGADPAAERFSDPAAERFADPAAERFADPAAERFADIASMLIRRLGESWPGCILVLDGSNDVANRGRAVAAGPGQPLDETFATVDRLVEAGIAASVQVVDHVNRSALSSVLWCSRADAVLAPLGDALGVYRWICNSPGVVLDGGASGHDPGTLRIYQSADCMESPTELLSASEDEEPDAVVTRFLDLVSRRLAARTEPEPASE